MLLALPLVSMCAVADSNVIGFWDFKGGTVGEEVGKVYDTSGQWEGIAYKANGNTGNKPTYSDACPPAVIFADSSRSEVLASDPHSLHFSIANVAMGGYVDIAGLSTELTSHSAFTVEFFANFDDSSGNPWTEPVCFQTQDRYASVTFGCGNSKMMKFNNLNISSPSTGSITSPSFSQNILNAWVHVAMVYEETDATAHAGALKCYVDRVLKATLAYTNTPLGQTSRPLRLGTGMGNNRVANAAYCFRGNICALRIKSVALDESGFMYSEKYAVPVGATLGFWDFKDGAVGTDANNVTNKGWLAKLDPGVGVALSSIDNGMKPQFSDDIPGQIIYSDASYQTVLVENPQSLLFTTENAGTSESAESQSVGGGKITFSELGSAITAQSSYTIECFFKDEDWSEWQWASGLFGFYANSESGAKANVQVMVSSVKSGKTSWNATLNPSGATYNKPSTWKDGNWHHLAVVYDGSSSNASLYVDYALGQTVAYTNYYRANENFLLGVRADNRADYTFRGKIACLRVMAEALAKEDFMVAVDDPRALQAAPDTVFAWNFEEGVDKIGLVITNAAGVPTFFETSADNTKVYCIFKNTLPQYASNRLVRTVMWNGEKLWENNVCGYFQGYRAVQGQQNAVYAGTEMNLPASSLPRRNPESWTMEARVKLEYLPTFLSSDDDIGALIFGKNGNTVIHASGTPAVYPAYSWILTVQKSGLLRIYWEIGDGEVNHTQNKDDRLYAATDAAYLSDMKWHHVALSYDKPTRTFKLYIDKQCVLEKYIGETDLFDGPFPYYFTRMQTTRGLEGWMDEIRFSSKVLQPEEFEQFASQGMLIFVR